MVRNTLKYNVFHATASWSCIASSKQNHSIRFDVVHEGMVGVEDDRVELEHVGRPLTSYDWKLYIEINNREVQLFHGRPWFFLEILIMFRLVYVSQTMNKKLINIGDKFSIFSTICYTNFDNYYLINNWQLILHTLPRSFI